MHAKLLLELILLVTLNGETYKLRPPNMLMLLTILKDNGRISIIFAIHLK